MGLLCAPVSAIPQSVDATVFQANANRYSSVTTVSLQANVVFGHGAAARNGTAVITVTKDREASLHIDMSAGAIDQHFTSNQGIVNCVVSFPGSSSDGPTLPDFCGNPVPWFFPFSFLPSLAHSPVQIIASHASTTSFDVLRAPLGQRHGLQHWPASFSFDSSGLLAKYAYRIPVSPGSPHWIDVYVVFSDYRQWEGNPIPFHIQQYGSSAEFVGRSGLRQRPNV